MLSGRVAFVSGGASGIGRAVSRVLAREGARVAVADLDEAGCKKTIEDLPGEGHLPLVANVASLADVNKAADAVIVYI